MATFTAYSRFDYRFFGLFSDYFEDQSATISGTTSVSISDGYSLAIITGTSLKIGQYGLTGYGSTIAMSHNGENYYKVTGLNYNFNNNVYDDGYYVSGKTLYGDLAELAYVMSGNDTLIGSNYADRLAGFNGTDTIKGGNGNDVLEGWDGNDKLYGEAGKDILTGGAGSDYFVFDKTTESGITSTTRDVIKDFSKSQGDKIDLKTIDAKAGGTSNDDFSFLSSAPTNNTASQSSNGKLWYSSGVLYGSTDTDKDAEFSIQVTLSGITTTNASEYILL